MHSGFNYINNVWIVSSIFIGEFFFFFGENVSILSDRKNSSNITYHENIVISF